MNRNMSENASLQRVLDIDTYLTYLEEANQYPEQSPQYVKLYNTRQDLEMDDLFPEQWDLLVRRLLSDEALYEKYGR